MTPLDDVRAASSLFQSRRGVIRWICTSNPFYVLSASLFLGGLWISFGGQTQAADTWALLGGLAGYTLLLSVTACLLVRFANIWDDVRTVLLLVALMFLAMSVAFDTVLILHPARGFACYLVGWAFAVTVSQGVLRGIRLTLPAGFRLPYYLLLALFFLYPLALSPLLSQPQSEALAWGLLGFSAAVGLVFLTLLPAVWRGPAYVRDNGSPWPWPLYPWALFAFLGCAVPARIFLLCWSMHGIEDWHRSIFGPYFLVPFGLAVAVLLLELGRVAGHRGVLGTALALPVGLVLLASVGHRPDGIYRTFRELFAYRLGGDPLFLTMLASVGFYAYAALRRVPVAVTALTGAVVALAFVGPNVLTKGMHVMPRPELILVAAVLQLALGLWRDSTFRCLVGTLGLAVAVAVAIPDDASALRGPIAFHLALFAVLCVGAAFDDAFARLLRLAGAIVVMWACLATLAGRLHDAPIVPSWAVEAYPFVMAALLTGYGLLLGHRPSLAIVGLVLACWLTAIGWRGYRGLRQVVVGLDYLALSLTLFAVAVLISLGKAGMLSRRLFAGGRRNPQVE
jgi:hypothetical protein